MGIERKKIMSSVMSILLAFSMVSLPAQAEEEVPLPEEEEQEVLAEELTEGSSETGEEAGAEIPEETEAEPEAAVAEETEDTVSEDILVPGEEADAEEGDAETGEAEAAGDNEEEIPAEEAEDASYEAAVYGDLEYEVNSDGTVTVTKYTGTAASVTVPSVIDGKTVTGIGSMAFYNKTALGTVVLPDTITTIGEMAFYNTSYLHTINWPASLKTIGARAFYNGNFADLPLPSGLETIGNLAFKGCGRLMTVYIPLSVVSMGNEVFTECPNLTTVTFEEGRTAMTTLGSGAFKDTGLKEITLPEGLTRVSDSMFESCSYLEKVYVSDTVTHVDPYAFKNCSKLKVASMPDTVTYFGYNVFERCTSLEDFVFPYQMVSLANSYNLFIGCTSLKNVTLPNSITEIPQAMFSGCSKLEYIDIPDSVTRIRKEAFKDCIWLKEFKAANVNFIMERSFYHCTSLETVETAPLDVLYESVFEDCPNLRTVSYMNVSQIPKNAFSGCLMLEEIRISGSQYRTVKENAFYNVNSQLKIYYYGTKAQYDATTVEAGNEAWTSAAVYYINEITSLSLSQPSLVMVLGTASAVKQLLVHTYPEDADVPELVWTNSDPSVATIDYEGVVTARAEGTTIISVATKDGRLRSSCTVTVQTVHVTSVKVTAPADRMKTGETVQLEVTVLPENASDKRVMWLTSDPEIATVDDNGLVTAVGGGVVEISAVPYDSDSLYDSVMITVEQAVTGVTISKASTVITLGRQEQLTASVLPASASNRNVTWSSSDPDTAPVTKDGLVTGKALGTAVITVRTEDGGYTASCYVTVDPVHPESVTISTPADWIRYGQFVQMSASLSPADTTDKTVLWSSSDESIAAVDENGKVTGTGEGTVTITATARDNGISTSQSLEVIFIHVQSVSFAEDELEIAAGRSKQLNVTVGPYNASDPSLIFESDSPEILTVDEKGRMTGVAEGTAVVTVTAKDGGFSDTCEIIVYPDEIYVSGIPESFIYTGSAIRPEPEVYDGRTLLTKGRDYTLAYKNNIKAGTASVTIKMTGNYTQSAKVEFAILPRPISDEAVTVNALTVLETGKKLVLSPVIMFNGKQLKKNTDFTVTYDETEWDGISPGEHELTIGGKGNFEGTRTMKVFVTPKDPAEEKISVSKLTVSSAAVNYLDISGNDFENEIIPHLTVKYGKNVLLEYSTDYIVNTFPEDYKKTGKCTFVISGIGRYYGEKTVSVTVRGIALSDKRIKDHENGPYMYTGRPIELDLSSYYMSWMDGETEVFIDPEDFEIVPDSYRNNVKAGTATVKLAGKNAYTGTRTVKFKITKNTITTEDDVIVEDPVPYAKGGAKPKVTINDLKAGTDYTLKYSANTKAGTGKVTVTFKGNCSGTKAVTKYFEITPQDLSVTAMTAKDILYSTKAGGYRVKPVLKDLNGKTLKLGTDYEKTLLYEEVILNGGYYQAVRELGTKDKAKAGTIIAVTAYGNGSYEGQNTAFYRVLPKGTDIAKAAFTIRNQEYTGEPVELDSDAFTKAVIGKTKLVLGEDFEIVRYSGNIKKGTASVTLRGIGNYGGTKTVKFKIVQKKLNEYWAGIKAVQP